jgi:hypothetical protein
MPGFGNAQFEREKLLFIIATAMVLWAFVAVVLEVVLR